MTQTFNENVVVDGAVDAIQLTVQGHSTQSNPLQVWEDSAGNDLARLTGDGRWQQGNMSMATNESLLEAHQDGTSGSVVKRGLNSKGRFTGAISDALSWLMSELELAGVGTITGIHRAIRAKLSHNNATGNSVNADLRAGDFEAANQSGTGGSPVGQMTGVQGRVDNQANANLTKARAVAGQVSNATGASIDTAATFEVLPPVNNGDINTLVGLEIPDITQGTENFAIRTGEGKVQFGDLIAGMVKTDASGLLGNAIKGTDFEIPMQGASSSTNGAAGVVPQPLAGDEGKFLRGDGTWAESSGGGGGASALSELSDVDTLWAANGSSLRFNGALWKALKHNLLATSNPTVEDGLYDGYDVDSIWINKASGAIWICADSTVPNPTPISEYASSNLDRGVNLQGPSGSGGTLTITASGTGQNIGNASGDQTWQAQSFIPNAGILDEITVSLEANFNSPTGNITWEYRTDNAGVPSSTVLASGTFTPVPSSTNTITVVGANRIFVSNTTYWLVLRAGNQTLNNAYRITISPSNPYANGMRAGSSNSGASWITQPLHDCQISVKTLAVNPNEKLSQGFQTASNVSLGLVSLWLRKLGSASGNLTVKIYNDSGGNPNVLLGTSNTVAATSLSTNFAEVEFVFASPVNLSSSVQYHIVLESTASPSNTDYVEWGADASTPGYAAGEMKSAVAAVWGSEGKDAIFQLFSLWATWELVSASRQSSGIPLVDPSQYTWTALNTGVGSFSVDGANKRLLMKSDGTGALNVRGFHTPIPHEAPYSIRVHIKGIFPNVANHGYCVFFRQSGTGKLVASALRFNTAIELITSKFNSPTALASTYANFAINKADFEWFKIEDNGTNRIVSISSDGVNWIVLHSIGRLDFLTGGADEVGVGLWVTTNAVIDTAATVLSWEVLQ